MIVARRLDNENVHRLRVRSYYKWMNLYCKLEETEINIEKLLKQLQ